MSEVETMQLLVSEIERQKNRHIKIALTRMESNHPLSPEDRKVLLDLANDLVRSIHSLINYHVER